MKVYSLLLSAGAVALGAVQGAAAQSATPLAPVVVTATRTEAPITSVGSAISVLSRAEIERSNESDVSRLLERVPGVTVTRSGGFGSTTSVRLRGADVRHTLVLIDGVRVNDPSSTGGEFDWGGLLVGDIERIEVLRGPQSALYGNEAMGGVINIITRRGEGSFGGQAEVQAGTYGTFGSKAGVHGEHGIFDYALSAQALKTEGFSRRRTDQEADGTQSLGTQARIGVKVADGIRVQASGGYNRQDSDYDPFAGVEGLYDEDRFNGRLDGIFDGFGNRLRQTVSVYGTDLTRRYGEGAPFASDNEYTGDTLGAEYQADLKLRQADVATLGVSARTESYATSGTFGASDGSTATKAAFAQYQWQVFTPLTLSLAGRWEDNEDFGGKGTYRLAGVYDIAATDTRLRASFGTGAKAPSLFQLFAPTFGNAALEVETSRGFDLGVEQEIGSFATVGLGYFDNSFRNLIDFDAVANRYVNLGRAEVRGIEANVTARPIPEVQVGLAYTLTQTKNLTGGTELPRRPEHVVNVSLDWQVIPSVDVGGTLRYSSTQLDSTFGTGRSGQGTTVDLRATWGFAPGWSVFGRLDNLFDADIEEVTGYRNSGRAVYTGIRATF